MAKDKKADGEAEKKRGRAVILPNGELRAEFIRRRYYDESKTRSEIVKELKEMDHEVPYQVVFAATKTKEKPVPKARGPKAETAETGTEVEGV